MGHFIADSIYTERYMMEPSENSHAYLVSILTNKSILILKKKNKKKTMNFPWGINKKSILKYHTCRETAHLLHLQNGFQSL